MQTVQVLSSCRMFRYCYHAGCSGTVIMQTVQVLSSYRLLMYYHAGCSGTVVMQAVQVLSSCRLFRYCHHAGCSGTVIMQAVQVLSSCKLLGTVIMQAVQVSWDVCNTVCSARTFQRFAMKTLRSSETSRLTNPTTQNFESRTSFAARCRADCQCVPSVFILFPPQNC